MKNLFVCHSQAQIILAIGLAKGRFEGCDNALLLFKDFSLSNELLTNLKNVFKTVSVRAGGSFPESNKKWRNKLLILISDILFIKTNTTSPYDKVFIVCDQNLQELSLIKKLYKLNNKTDFIWLEDGSYPYFLNIKNKHGLNANKITIYIRKILFKYFFQLGFIYDYEGNYMSGNKNLKAAYLTLPNYARDIFRNKKLVEIERYEYLLGIKYFYPTLRKSINQNSDIIIVFDKFDTYLNFEKIKEITISILELAALKDKKVSFKLHPREEEMDLSFLDGARELNKNLGFEFHIQSIVEKQNNDVKVIGFKSTTLQVSKFFNLDTISLFLLTGEENIDLYEFYRRMDIKLPESIEKIERLI